MANFKKISFVYMCAMSIVTMGLYLLAWVVDTTRQLRAAGGKVPSLYFYFARLLVTFAAPIIILIANRFGFTKSTDIINSHSTLIKIFITIFPLYFWYGYVRS